MRRVGVGGLVAVLLIGMVVTLAVDDGDASSPKRDAVTDVESRAASGTEPVGTGPFSSIVVLDAVTRREDDGRWSAVAHVAPLDLLRIGADPVGAELTLELPTGRTLLRCTAVQREPMAEVEGAEPAMGTVTCPFAADGFLVPGLPGRLRIVAFDLDDARTVPSEAIELDRGSLSSGTVIVVRDGRHAERAVRVVGTNGLLVAVDGDLGAGDRVVVPHP